MKSLFAFLLAATASTAVAFDEAEFGTQLNGWQRDGSAHYALNGARYRTLKPRLTTHPEGNTVIRVTVIHLANSWAEVPFDLDVIYGSNGALQGTRISGRPRGEKLDTGVIPLPSPPEAPATKDAVPAGNAGPFAPITEMEKSLFASFESKISGASETKDIRKRDLLARIAGPEPIEGAALSAGLRYNLDLLLGGSKSPSK